MVYSEVVGIVSGLVLALVGVGLLMARPRRPGSRLFSAFVVVWGTEVSLFNSLSFASPELGSTLFAAGTGLIVVETLFLVHFAVRFSGLFTDAGRWWTYLAAGYTLVVGGLFAIDPGLFLDGFVFTTAGSLAIIAPNFAALFVILSLMVSRYLRRPPEMERREITVVFGALGLYAAYTAGWYLVFYASFVELGELTAIRTADAVFLALFAAGTVYVLALARRLYDVPEGEQQAVIRRRRLLSAALAVPVAAGLATSLVESLEGPRLQVFGLLRIGSALLIAYALLKFEIFDIDRKVKTAIRRTAIGATFVLAFFGISESVEFFVGEAVGRWAGLGAAGLMTLAFRPIEEGATQLANRVMPGVDDSDAYARERKSEVYQAAVERAAGDEVLTEREKQILAGLREDLGLGTNQAHEIERRVLEQPVAVDTGREEGRTLSTEPTHS